MFCAWSRNGGNESHSQTIGMKSMPTPLALEADLVFWWQLTIPHSHGIRINA